jgi:hypothetical protein
VPDRLRRRCDGRPRPGSIALASPETVTGVALLVEPPLPSSPEAIELAPVKFATDTGLWLSVRVPLPSCPEKFCPQQRAVPSVSTAQV